MTTDTQYVFSSLLRGEYTVSIQAQSVEYPSIVSEVVTINISLTREGVCIFCYVCLNSINSLQFQMSSM